MELPANAVSADQLEITLAGNVETRKIHLLFKVGAEHLDLGPVDAKEGIPALIMGVVQAGEVGDMMQRDIDMHPDLLVTDVIEMWENRLHAPDN